MRMLLMLLPESHMKWIGKEEEHGHIEQDEGEGHISP